MNTALVLFSAANEHWAAGILHPTCRHVWCMVLDERSNMWLSHNFGPEGHTIIAECPADYPVVEHYRDIGQEVYVIPREAPAVLWPMMLNNCVSLTKAICGIRSWAITPHQLRADVRRLAIEEDAAWRSFALS